MDAGWKIIFLLGWLSGRCYVSFRECIVLIFNQFFCGFWKCHDTILQALEISDEAFHGPDVFFFEFLDLRVMRN